MFWARVKIQISQTKHVKNEEWDDKNNPWTEKNNLRSSEKNQFSYYSCFRTDYSERELKLFL